MPISAAQCRAARALLGWTQHKLATEAEVSRSTVADFERNARWPITNNLASLKNVLAQNGVIFVPEDNGSGAGVRLVQAP